MEVCDEAVLLPEGLSWPAMDPSRVLLTRHWSKELFEEILAFKERTPGAKGVLVTGNPGIGKSWFLCDCLWRLAQMKRTVFYEHYGMGMAWLFLSNGHVVQFDLESYFSYPPELQSPDTFYFFDPADSSPRTPRLGIPAFTIVASSPNPVHYKQFFKQQAIARYYMPCWSLDELHSVLPHFPGITEQLLAERFAKFGGIPRYVLNNDKRWDDELEDAIKNCNMSLLDSTVGGRDLKSKVSHKLFQFDVASFSVSPIVRFPSPYVAEQVTARLLETETKGLYNFINYSKAHPSLASVRGDLFASAAHRLICRGGSFCPTSP